MRISDWSSDVCSSDLSVACEFGKKMRMAQLSMIADAMLEFWMSASDCVAKMTLTFRLRSVLSHWRMRAANIGSSRNSQDASRISRSEEHTSELQSLLRISYAVFCLQKKTTTKQTTISNNNT